jgi:hypothetical protein
MLDNQQSLDYQHGKLCQQIGQLGRPRQLRSLALTQELDAVKEKVRRT